MKKLHKKQAYIKTCNFSDIRSILEEYHYKKGHIGGGISVCFAMFINNKLVGGSVLGKPRHEKKYKNCIDIRRMALLDEAPFNSESWFLSQIIKWIGANTNYENVLSYSDETVGHIGTIYKASNFKNIGKTAVSKYVQWGDKQYHPRSITVDREYSYKMREALKNGEAKIITGKPKTIWLFRITKKMKKKTKLQECFMENAVNHCLIKKEK